MAIKAGKFVKLELPKLIDITEEIHKQVPATKKAAPVKSKRMKVLKDSDLLEFKTSDYIMDMTTKQNDYYKT